MPLTPTLKQSRLVAVAHRTRESPLLGYGIGLASVVVAALLRLAVAPLVMGLTPFTTFYPAIIVATLFGGLGAGIVAALCTAAIVWFAFLPPYFSFEIAQVNEIGALVLFLCMSAMIITLVVLLNRAIERLVAQERNIGALVEGAPNGIVVVDESGVIRTVNRGAEAIFGYDRSEMLGQKIEMLLPEGKRMEHLGHRREFLRKPETRAMGAGRDLTALHKDSHEVPVEIGLSPVSRDEKTAVVATVVDISERRKAQEKQEFLIRELRHRSQNLFAVVRAIGARSLDEGKTVKEAKDILDGRLAALARAHEMLAEAAWTGAPLDAIIREELEAFAEHVTIDGCDLLVNTPAAQQFALIVHELATNAAKHGALSSPMGKVRIVGKTERVNGEQIFTIEWTESGGPKVRKPRRKGFGSTILVDGVRKFGRHADLRFAAEGVEYEMRVSLGNILPEQKPPPASLVS